jgi:hypothetical protein
MLQEYTDFTGGVTTATFSPDGTQLAFSDSALHVWQLRLDDPKTVNNPSCYLGKKIDKSP